MMTNKATVDVGYSGQMDWLIRLQADTEWVL